MDFYRLNLGKEYDRSRFPYPLVELFFYAWACPDQNPSKSSFQTECSLTQTYAWCGRKHLEGTKSDHPSLLSLLGRYKKLLSCRIKLVCLQEV